MDLYRSISYYIQEQFSYHHHIQNWTNIVVLIGVVLSNWEPISPRRYASCLVHQLRSLVLTGGTWCAFLHPWEMDGWKDRRYTVEFIDLSPHNFALAHCHGDWITNSLAEEAKGGRVELSTMGWSLLVSHLFWYFDMPCIIYMQRDFSGHFSLIGGREGMSLGLIIIRAYQNINTGGASLGTFWRAKKVLQS